MSDHEDSQNLFIHSYGSSAWSQTSSSQSSSSSERPAASPQKKPVEASTCAPSTSAAQVVSVARSVDEGFILLDDRLLLEQPSYMQKAQVHELRNLMRDGYQLSYRATWKNIISLHELRNLMPRGEPWSFVLMVRCHEELFQAFCSDLQEQVGRIGQEWFTRLVKSKDEEKARLKGMMASKEANSQDQEKIQELKGEKAQLKEEAARCAEEVARLKAELEQERSGRFGYAAVWAAQDPEQFAAQASPDREAAIRLFQGLYKHEVSANVIDEIGTFGFESAGPFMPSSSDASKLLSSSALQPDSTQPCGQPRSDWADTRLL
ncbi:unnamed protein product [Cuscuta campestris]|uniref:Uncharacterized protein n=1 Tax=Cuscuta campestris TaxID=132261 RepID=A0A484KGC0_9ASTE|nr:unnamed protein product [Cuscuta campestris]